MIFMIDAIVTPGDVANEKRQAHIDFLVEQYEAGTFLMFGRYLDGSGGGIVAQADSREALDAITAQDPFSQAGVIASKIREFAIGKVSEAILAAQ